MQKTLSTRQVTVELGARAYRIDIGAGLLTAPPEDLASHFARPRTAVITDKNVAGAHLDKLESVLADKGFETTTIVLEPGEPTKSWPVLSRTVEALLDAGIERNDTIIAFGGGVIGDLAGFAAAILRRGIKFVQIPTTLLAQVDSSVGGKTGINSKLGKNLIGAFHQPAAVLIDVDLLETLPKREFAAGYAEVMKYGLLGNAEFFAWLEKHQKDLFRLDRGALIQAVETCCLMKADIVARDEHEAGPRALLNLGHTFGHALEAVTGYSDRLLHGEGVAVGINLAFRLSAELGLCAKDCIARIEHHIKASGLPHELASIPGDLPPADQLTEVMLRDKKAQSGRLVLVLVRGIGEAFVTRDIDRDKVCAFLDRQLNLK
jgi:3-dehydroquinate synthase